MNEVSNEVKKEVRALLEVIQYAVEERVPADSQIGILKQLDLVCQSLDIITQRIAAYPKPATATAKVKSK